MNARPRIVPTGRWHRWLGRETASTGFIPEIDGLRFVAIMSVILYHLCGFYLVKSGRPPDTPARILELGNFGVPLFFVISGFVIALPFARAQLSGGAAPPLRAYYLRRLTRLEPPYILNLLLVAAALVLVKHDSLTALLPPLGASLVYSHTLLYGVFSAINGVAWSLEVECQFYVLAPAMVTVFQIRSPWVRRLLLVGVLVAWSAAAQAGPVDLARFKLSLLFYAPYFLAGLLLADLYLADWAEAPRPSATWDLGAAACWLALPMLLAGWPSLHFLLPLVVLGAYVGAFRGVLWPRLFTWAPVYLVGGMCYTIYLYHFFVISLIGNPLLPRLSTPGAPVWANVLILSLAVIPVTVAACAALFVLTEKPFMRRAWPAQVARWLRGSVPAGAASAASPP
jgi:peptidoglycan/LPS O-acetylase OafA/YrhL